ncbi:hypothetical protein, conserved [Babesia bigemina]|uniref:AP2/ERF domain-containing protein n=1 Tax=Babesia bigemina TaxID=5866 RepID=A0A061DCC8_BABBI|nr:hypothetical protein, conserved [Babesia bigemina]CDR97722.1 hypothetical protein, conserved [Babesia bigemina]|eukprot:XP_012769908.1 hypothetical protein, conserved [Babesia bigemina]
MMCASVMIAGDGMEQLKGNAGGVMLSHEVQEAYHMSPMNCTSSPARTCASTPGRMLPLADYDYSNVEHWSAPSRMSIPNEPQWAYNIHPAYNFGQSNPPVDILAEYAQYHDTIAAQNRKIMEMQYQIEQMQAQYSQYQCLFSAANHPRYIELEYGDDLNKPLLPPSPIGSSPPPTPSPAAYFGYDNGYLLPHDATDGNPQSFMSYGATAPCTPSHTDSPTMSVNTTPNNVDTRCMFSTMDGAANVYYTSPEGVENCVDDSTKPVLSLCSMASVSTVDLMNEEVYRGMGAEFAGDEADNNLCVVRKRKWSIEEEYTASPPLANERKRRVSVDVSITDVMRQPQRPHFNPYEECLTPALIPSPPTWRFDNNVAPSVMGIPNVCYPFPSIPPFATEPVVNGQINHDYYRRDFYSTVWEQGYNHLFPESTVLWYPKAMASLPLSHGSTGIVSCTTGGGSIDNQNAVEIKGDAECTVVHQSPTYACQKAPSTTELLGATGSDEYNELTAQLGNDAQLCRRMNGSTEECMRPRNKKGKAHRPVVLPNNEKKREIEAAIKRMIELNKEQIEMVEALKALEVGGMMVIHKRKTQKDSAMEIRKATKCYDYLLDIPLTAEPDPELGEQQFKCLVPGVYWDKRSWIASWYEDGVRHYSSFSAKMHGFYRAKYFAIQVRMYKTQNHTNLLDEEAVEKERQNLIDCYGQFPC